MIYLTSSLGIQLLIYFTIYKKNYKAIKIIEMTTFIIHFLSFFFTIIVNPGIPDRKYYYKNYINNIKKKDKSEYDRCKICNIITPKVLNVTHCYYCDVCVVNQDHHCTCLGKCVGKNNCILFYMAIVTIPLFAVMGFVTLISYVIYLDDEEREIRKYGRHKQ